MSGQQDLRSIRELFEALFPLNSSERSKYLNSRPELPAKIIEQTLRLLQVDGGNGSLPRLDTILPSALIPQRELQPGDRLGPYELVRFLGSGGMGVVYEAVRQEGDISLRAAIKLLHPELCTPEFLLQLHREISTLASLSHPNIARLLDWELGQSGNSFFVLEYVEGDTLTVFCREHSLDTRARLRLFLEVCSAASHAHQKLIVHLDLKPENILVNAAGEVKLLDFGVACTLVKANAIGSPLHAFSARYASPEQISGGPVSVLCDVYSLGIVLREALSDSSEEAANEIPAFPLPFELEAIAARASAQEPANRYTSVDELGQDILRLLSMRPVLAVSQTRSYQLNRFCRRNFLRLVMIAMAAGMLFVGLVALYKHHEERFEHLRVERLRQSVHQLSSTILFPLEEEMRNLPGATPARMLAVQTGLQFLKSLADDGGNDPKLATEIAEAYLKLGDIQGNPTNANLGDDKGAYESYEMARHLLADNRSPEGRYVYGVLLTHEGDLVYEDGQKQTAAKMYTESVRRLSELDHAGNTNMKLKESLELALNDLADVQSEERHADLARSNYDEALELAQQLILTNPGDITLQRDLARCYSRHGDLAWNAGNWQIAVTAYRKSFDIYDRLLRQYPDNVKVQHSWIAGANNIGDADVKLNRLDEALNLYKRVQKIEDHAVALDPANKMALRDQQVSYSNMTHVLLHLHNLAGAEQASHHGVAIAKALWNQNKHSALAIEDLSGSEEDLAEVENKKHRYSSAVSDEKQALQLRYENLRNSGSNDNLADVIEGLERLGNYELDLASATPSAKTTALKDVAKTVDQLHQLRSRFQPGTAEDKARADSIQALEARFWQSRHR